MTEESEPASPAAADRFRAIFDQTFQFIALLDVGGRVLEVNQAALDFISASRSDIVGRLFWDTPWWALSPGPSAGSEQSLHDRLRASVVTAATGTFVRYEVALADPRGGLATFDFSLKPLRDAAGAVESLIAEGRNVTDRRRVEEELRTSEAKLAGIVSIAADAIVSVDDAQRITLFNQGAERIFGYAPSEVLGQHLDILIPERYRASHHRHVEGFGEGRIDARRMGDRAEIFGRRKSGELFPAEASISRIDVEGHRFYTAVLRDVSDRYRAEEEKTQLLRREQAARRIAEAAERRARFLAEVSAVLSSSLDYEETLRTLADLLVPEKASFVLIDLWNEAGGIRRLYSTSADPEKARYGEEILRQSVDVNRPFITRNALVHGSPELVSAVTDAWLRAATQSDEHYRLWKAIAPRSLMTVPLVARGRTLGAMVFASGSAADRPYDAGDLAEAEAVASRAALAVDNARLYGEAQRATRLREEVLGIVSHDLRNPLSVISMCATTLVEGSVSAERAASLGETIAESADWMRRLIGDLLDMASIEAGRLSLERHTTDLAMIVVSAADMLERQAKDRGVRVEIDLPDDLAPVEADDDRVLQVLANLIGNAIKFTESGGTVAVRAHMETDRVRVEVADTGAGIPAADLPHIFDRFWTSRRTSKVKGTGLGLAISKGIVEAHGGRLRAESDVGRGSTFAFTLPLAAGTD